MITIRITKNLEDWWIGEEDAKTVSDQELIELVHEDLSALCEGATFEVIRKRGYDDLSPGELNDIDA